MQETCVILWSSSRISLALYNEVGARLELQYHIEAGDLSEYVKDRRVVVLTLDLEVSFLSVQLPKLAPRALAKALPYALEDQCIAPIESLHFVASPWVAGAETDVAVMNQSDLRATLQTLEANGVKPTMLLPAVLMLPLTDGGFTVITDEHQAYVRVSETAGFMSDLASLDLMLEQAMDAYGKPARPITRTALHHTAFVDAFLPQQWVEPAYHVLQGAFQPRQSYRLPQGWMLGALGAGVLAWAVLSIGLPMISWGILSHRESMLQSAMKAIYTPIVPEAHDASSAKYAMEKKLVQMNEGSDQAILRLLSKVADAMQGVNGIQVKRLNDEGDGLSLEVSAQSSALFASFAEALASQGLHVQQQSASLSGERINAQLLIR